MLVLDFSDTRKSRDRYIKKNRYFIQANRQAKCERVFY